MTKLWCSSHGKPRRKLPYFLEEEFRSNEVFDIPIVDAIGGRTLGPNEVNAIIWDAKINAPKKQWHIIMLGGNNLRKKSETVESFMAHCKELAAAFEGIPNAKLVFMGMIPSPGTDSISKKLFVEANSQMRLLSQNQRSNSFA